MRPVRKIAQESRDWAENVAELLGHSQDLMGMCAIASTHLMIRLLKEGYTDARVRKVLVEYHGEHLGHCYVEVDGWIVDITATQFDEGAPNECDISFVLMFLASERDTPPSCVARVAQYYATGTGKTYKSQSSIVFSQKKERWSENETAYLSHLKPIPIPVLL